jgi:Mor family transcriptional regulator
LADLVECLPVAAVLSLIERFGGTVLRIPLPDNLTEEHELVKTIGAEAARRLCGLCGAVEITFPKGVGLEKLARTRQIRYLRHEKKWRISKLARYFRVTERAIYNALSSDE